HGAHQGQDHDEDPTLAQNPAVGNVLHEHLFVLPTSLLTAGTYHRTRVDQDRCSPGVPSDAEATRCLKPIPPRREATASPKGTTATGAPRATSSSVTSTASAVSARRIRKTPACLPTTAPSA